MARASAKTEPAILVIMGATGDLMRRKVLPALYRLAAQGAMNERNRILGSARRADLDDQGFRALVRQDLADGGAGGEPLDRWCRDSLFFQSIGKGGPEDFLTLGRRIEAIEREQDLPGNRLFYLALPPEAVAGTVGGLGRAGLNRSGGWTRLVIEKPFGRDLASAEALNGLVHQDFEESQIYRIDHYLGKETVQNLLVFRFSNPVFENLWNRDRVESVQITVAEQVGIEGRAGYYAQAGALRDIVQNHLTQLMALIAMEVPGAFDADDIRNEKVKVLRAIPPIGADAVVLGQYARGDVDGLQAPGFLEEPGIAAGSRVETFAALRLEVANWRWQGVPFYLRTGKRLPRRVTQIVITFRCPPVAIFGSAAQVHANALSIMIQPDEGFDLSFEVKAPGMPVNLQTQRLHFRYAEAFAPLADAYETLLVDVLQGDQTLFVRADEVEASWRLYTPILNSPPPAQAYPAGTWGPSTADALLAADGNHWFPL